MEIGGRASERGNPQKYYSGEEVGTRCVRAILGTLGRLIAIAFQVIRLKALAYIDI